MIVSYAGKTPQIHDSCFLAPDCQIIGDVTLDEESSVWFGAVIRGDINWVRIGKWTNIQDRCIIHVTGGTAPATLGNYVTVGHGAILHGCTIESGCLIGMGSVILDQAVIGEGSLVAAGSVVKAGAIIKPGSMVAGNPAVVRRKISSDEKDFFLEWARNYREYARGYRC